MMALAKRTVLYGGVALVTFMLGMFAVKIVRHQPQETPWQVLLSSQNQDLKQLSDERRRTLQKAIVSVVGAQNPREFPFFPRMFRMMANTNGETRYVLVQERPLLTIPGEPRVRTHIFDSLGRFLTSDEFSGGWRTHVKDLRVAKNALLNQDALVVDGVYWTGKHWSRHYYVLVGDRIVPAYLEEDGELKRDEYLLANAAVAPSIR